MVSKIHQTFFLFHQTFSKKLLMYSVGLRQGYRLKETSKKPGEYSFIHRAFIKFVCSVGRLAVYSPGSGASPPPSSGSGASPSPLAPFAPALEKAYIETASFISVEGT